MSRPPGGGGRCRGVVSPAPKNATLVDMGRRLASGSVLLVLLWVALTASAQAALSRSGDVAATSALARATNTLVSAARPDIGRGLAAAKSYANQIAAECPGAAAKSPQDRDSEQLDDELIGAMTAVGYHAAAAPIAVFAHTVERLHWSNGRLTRAVRTIATKLVGLSTLAIPNLCGDIEGWVASGYATLPPSTTQFNRSYSAVDPEAEEVPLIISLAEPYSTPSDFAVLRHVERFEARLGEAEAQAVGYYTHLVDTLELEQ
jgi:hypothetical protein